MISVSDSNIKKIFCNLLILSGLAVSLFSQDKQIGGVINVYRHVESIGPGMDNVTLNTVDSIAPGDTVLLIQMKGAVLLVPETGTFGGLQDTIGAPGSSEFLIVQSVNTGTRNVVFNNDILKTFNISGNVQLIRVPFYNSAIVNANLTCQAWDSTRKTGGVLAMIVGSTLSLDANIDVTGKGFAGGTPFLGLGICINDNTALYDKFSYPGSYLNSGFKGESQAIRAFLSVSDKPSIYPAYAKGKGANLTGGGGGNGKFPGGGGGANYGAGGIGGRETSALCTPNDGGIGGKKVKFTDLDGGIFLGGGGGSSTFESGAATASAGSRGGGIIIILCDTLKGKGKIIKADGATPAITASGNAGAGGGGSGGSIALYQQSFSTLSTSALTISANGGKGGNNSGSFGEGGGGGGGLILTNNITIPGNVTKSISGGAVGTRSGGSTGGTGLIGESLVTYTPALNGFLYNSVRSSVTGNLVDSVCSNTLPPLITGTKPVGGTLPYTYLWEKSYNEISWTPLVNDADPTNYTPTVIETVTVYFRRTITDSSIPSALVDVSKSVKIFVQPAITGNLVGKDTTICFNQNPLSLIPLNAGPSNGSSHNYYLYKWIQNITNTNWNTSSAAAGTSANPGYDPPALTNTTFYQRVVTSGRCVNFSSTVTITVLPLITGNITSRPDSVICEGSEFVDLGASAAGGGDLTFMYQWQDSIASSVWAPAIGINTGTTYTPDTSTFAVTEQRFLRRVVYSGPDSVCKSRSIPILLTRYHKIKNNSILSDQTICSGITPAPLSGSSPTGGNGSGSYTYIWQDSIRTGVWTNRGITDFSFSPANLTDTTWYRRIVNSSKCTNKSPSIRINVHKPILNNNISVPSGGVTDTICPGLVPVLLQGTTATGGTNIPGNYSYQWRFSTDNITFNPVPSGGTGVAYQPPVLTATTYYKRQVTSGACSVTSSETITVTVLQPITGNTISANKTAVCYNSVPDPLTGATLSGGAGPGTYSYLWEQSTDGGTTWTAASGINTSASYQPPPLKIPMKYKRTIKSGSFDCTKISSIPLDIGINPLPGSIINAGPDVPLYYSIEKIFHMAADPVLPGETGSWSVIGNGTSSIVDFSNNKAKVRNLSVGKNTFLWTITNNLCKLEDTVSVTLLEDFVPQGFSPNGDSWNNTFIIEGLNLPDQEVEVKVVNGAGTEVFSTSNRPGQTWTNWDGKNSRGLDLPEGTYYYLLKVTSKEGQVFKKSGFIILKRY